MAHFMSRGNEYDIATQAQPTYKYWKIDFPFQSNFECKKSLPPTHVKIVLLFYLYLDLQRHTSLFPLFVFCVQ